MQVASEEIGGPVAYGDAGMTNLSTGPSAQLDLSDALRFSTDGTAGVLYKRSERIAHIVFDRPEKLNAFNDAQVIGLRRALDHFDEDEDAWVAIVSGAGRAFSAGADVQERLLRDEAEMARLRDPGGKGAHGHGLLYECTNWKPVIAAAHGFAYGIALSFLLEADLAVVTDDLQMQISETRRGLWGSLHWRRLQFRGAGALADELALTARVFSGAEAAAARVVTRAVPPGQHIEGALELAKMVLENPPLAIRATVRARRFYMQQNEQSERLLWEGNRLHMTEDARESARAFSERRPPRAYAGR